MLNFRELALWKSIFRAHARRGHVNQIQSTVLAVMIPDLGYPPAVVCGGRHGEYAWFQPSFALDFLHDLGYCIWL